MKDMLNVSNLRNGVLNDLNFFKLNCLSFWETASKTEILDGKTSHIKVNYIHCNGSCKNKTDNPKVTQTHISIEQKCSDSAIKRCRTVIRNDSWIKLTDARKPRTWHEMSPSDKLFNFNQVARSFTTIMDKKHLGVFYWENSVLYLMKDCFKY